MRTKPPHKLKQMSAEVEHMRESDRLFFERFPWRQYRLRRLGRAEIAQIKEATGAVLVVADPDTAMFVIVKNLASGVRLRLHVPGPADETGEEATEPQIAGLWALRAARNPAIAQQEMQVRGALTRPGGPLHKARGGA